MDYHCSEMALEGQMKTECEMMVSKYMFKYLKNSVAIVLHQNV